MSKRLILLSVLAVAAPAAAEGSPEAQWQAQARVFDRLAGAEKDAVPAAGAPRPQASSQTLPSPPSVAAAPASSRRYLLERVGSVGFVQLYVDGFERLPLDQKTLAYHLSQAALAGDDIVFDQTHRQALAVKDALQEILAHRESVDPAVLAKIRSYFLLVWANKGNYERMTGKKFVPEFGADELKAAARAAMTNGAFAGASPADVDARLAGLERAIFDPTFDPELSKSGTSQDIVAGGAVNFYDGVTQKEVEAHDQGKPYPIVDSLSKENGVVKEKIWRAGDPARGIPPGLYAQPLGKVVESLEKALPYASSPKQREALGHLIEFFKTGDPADFKEYNRAWVHDDSPVDLILGFIETYMDPLGRRPSFEGMISFRDPEFTSVIRTVAGNSFYFEQAAPWAQEYKKAKAVPITANAVNMVTQTGDAGNKLLLGVNLPNDQNLRQTEGSKNIMISNALDSMSGFQGATEMREFASDAREAELYAKHGDAAYRIHVSLHEVIGHASGKTSDRLQGHQPQEYIKDYYAALEEARAECFGLWAIADPKLAADGVVKDPDVVEASYRTFVTKGGLIQLKQLPSGDRLTQAHARARNLIVQYLIRKTKAVAVEERNGKVYLRVSSLPKMRDGVGELLGRLQTIKAEGDYAGAQDLFETYGDRIDTAWRDQVVARYKALNLPTRIVPVSSTLVPVLDADGRIADVVVRYPATVDEAALGPRRGGKPLPLGRP